MHEIIIDTLESMLVGEAKGVAFLSALFLEKNQGGVTFTQNIGLDLGAPRGTDFVQIDDARAFLTDLEREVTQNITQLENYEGDFLRSISTGEEDVTINGVTKEVVDDLLTDYRALQDDIDEAQRDVAKYSSEERKELFIDLYRRATLLDRQFEKIENGDYV